MAPALRDIRQLLVPLLACLVLLSTGCASLNAGRLARQRQHLGKRVDAIIAEAPVAGAQWGILVRERDTGATVYGHNAGKLFTPASNVKILTAATALTALGPEFRFVTELTAHGSITDGVLDGDLVVTGTGDPTLDRAFHEVPTAVFTHWAAVLNQQGIHRVTGDLVGIDPLSPGQFGDGWAVDDLPYAYAAPVSMLQLNRNTPTTAGDPAAVYIAALAKALHNAGVQIDGQVKVMPALPDTPGRTLLVSHASPPLAAVLDVMMKDSVNLYAESAIRAVGQHRAGQFTFNAGRDVAVHILATLDLRPGTYRWADGSGLSRYNYLSPQALVSVLCSMADRHSKVGDAWLGLFPVAGVDGTLAHRLEGTPLAGNLRAKTGSMSSVRTLSGYLTAAAGSEYVFSMLVNGHMAPRREVDERIDRILLAVYKHPAP